MRTSSKRLWALALLFPSAGVAVIAACSASPLDLGATAGSPDASPGATASVAGTWLGFVEAYHFNDGDDHLRLTITMDPDGGVDASVFLGTGAPLAPPTDPNTGYPPGYWSAGAPPNATSMTGLNAPVEHFEFTARSVSVEAGGHVRVSFAQNEVWAAWCALQQKIYPVNIGDETGLPAYACCDPGALDASDSCDPSQTTPSDPGKVALCTQWINSWPACRCNASQCGIDASTGDTELDLQLDPTGGTLQGSISGLARLGAPFTVYLARAQ
jgi:hypothetical protein